VLAPNIILQNHYRVIRQLGEGGMGTVYEALDQRVSAIVALKQTKAGTDAESRHAFEREAALLANLRHQSLPKVMDHFAEDEGEFLVMEFIPGYDLAEMLELRGSPFEVNQVLRWADELLKVLEYLHGRTPPILHRDIKPSNLKTTKQGEIFLLDFGLAKGAAGQMPTLDMSRSVRGFTYYYSPPEQIMGQGTDPRSDLYSLGATLYHLLTGITPSDAPTRDEHVEDDKPDPLRIIDEVNPRVPSAVAVVIHQAMEIKRKNRPASATEMRRALRRAEDEAKRGEERRRQAEEQRQQQEEEAEKQRVTEEVERLAAEERRRLEEVEKRRQKAEAQRQRREAKRRRALEEAAQREAEEQARQQAEEERKRREAETAAMRVEEERQRLEEGKQHEAQRRRAAEEAARKLADEQEAGRRAEEEENRHSTEEAAARREAEEDRRREDYEQLMREAEQAKLIREQKRSGSAPAGEVTEAALVSPSADAQTPVAAPTQKSQGSNTPSVATLKVGPPERIVSGDTATPPPALPADARGESTPVHAYRRHLLVALIAMAVLAFVSAAVLMFRSRVGGSSSTSSKLAEAVHSNRTSNGATQKIVTSTAVARVPRTGTLMKNQLDMQFVYVPAGTFRMGTNGGISYEKPARDVTIKEGFYMGKYEVTQKEWKAVMGNRPSFFKGDDLPVEQVSWDDAQEFIARLNARGDEYIYRLPTEAEWEYACRANTKGDYAGDLDSMAWYGNNSGREYLDAEDIYRTDKGNYKKRIIDNGNQTHPVGKQHPNDFGLYDMHGNVWEWCEDWYHDNYKGTPPSDGSAWLSEGDQRYRVFRGGSWYSSAGGCRCAYRLKLAPEPGNNFNRFGFRVVAVART
jgi:formylglycine-generating enzyme required for sulfatase activity